MLIVLYPKILNLQTSNLIVSEMQQSVHSTSSVANYRLEHLANYLRFVVAKYARYNSLGNAQNLPEHAPGPGMGTGQCLFSTGDLGGGGKDILHR